MCARDARVWLQVNKVLCLHRFVRFLATAALEVEELGCRLRLRSPLLHSPGVENYVGWDERQMTE